MITFILGLVIGAVIGYLFALWEVWSDREAGERDD